MAQPLPPEANLPEAPDRTAGSDSANRTDGANWTDGANRTDGDGHPHIRLLQDPPERKVTGPRPRPGVRKRTSGNDVPLPPRGVGMTITSYLISGLLAYGLIGWLVGRAVPPPHPCPGGRGGWAWAF